MTHISRRTALIGSALALSLAACGKEDAPKATATDQNVELRMTVWTSNEAHLSLFNGIAEEYRKGHPNVSKITFDALPFENYSTTLTTQLAGGNAPDLAWIFETDAPDFVASKALFDLTDTLKGAEGFEFDDVLASTRTLWEQDGKLFAYPFSTSPFGVFINKSMIQKAKGDDPAKLSASGQWTWDGAFDLAKKVAAAGNKAGLVIRDFDYKGWDQLASVWRGWGADPWNEDGTACTFTSPEMTQAMTRLHQAIFVDKSIPAPGTTADFFAGEAGLTITQISRASLLKDAKFDWDLVPLPTGPGGPAAVIGQAGIGVLRNAAHPQVAADFLAFFTNKANSARLAEFFPPPRGSLLTAESLGKANPLLTPEQLEKVVVEGIKTGRTKPSHTNYAQINQKVRAALDPLWKADADVSAVLGGVCETLTPLLGK